MKRQINSRTILTIATIAVASLVLLLLATPGLGGGSVSLQLLTLSFSILPLLILVTLLSYIYGKSAKSVSEQPANSKTAKILAALVVITGLLSLIFTHASIDQPINHGKFVLENIGTGLLFVAFVAAVSLVNIQNFVYWPFWSKSDKASADERQLIVRQRVFEKSYRYILVIFALAGFVFNSHVHRMNQFLVWLVILAALSMPALIAAWQKDS